MTGKRGSPTAWGGPLPVLMLFVAGLLVVRPWGNYPLNDDWDFAFATFHFAQTGEFAFTKLTVASLRAQVVWGALWVSLFGHSYLVLRLSTMGLAVVAIALAHRYVREAGGSKFGAAMAALTLAFHPIFFWSSTTYMTEVPFVTASVASLVFLQRAWIRRSAGWLAGAVAAAGIALLIRQSGVALAFGAAGAALALRRRGERAHRLAAAAAGLILVLFVSLLTMTDWLLPSAEVGEHVGSSVRNPLVVLGRLVPFTEMTLESASLFVLPLGAAALVTSRRGERVRWMAVFIGVVALLAPRVVDLLTRQSTPPWSPLLWGNARFGSIFVNLGLGPLTLPDVRLFETAYPVNLPGWGRLVVTGAALVAALGVIAALSRLREVSPPVAALVSVQVASVVLLAFSAQWFDRYALDALWALGPTLALVLDWTRFHRVVALAVAAAVAMFGILATAEYHAWNGARWKVVAALERMGVPSSELDGGWEVNAARYPGRFGEIGRAEVERPGAKYVIAFRPHGGRVVARSAYGSVLGGGDLAVFGVAREEMMAATAPE